MTTITMKFCQKTHCLNIDVTSLASEK